ncbi:MAG: hypothetical protein LLG40_14390 [Deltaproteobacteria bacterium]|nr:hypothetical protein [Deltaproteobacteria bacterium]
MKIRISFEVFTEYMKVNLSGDSLYAEIKDVLMNIRKLAEENNHTRIIIDAVNTKVLSEMEKFSVGEIGVDIFGNKFKIAVIAKPEVINKFMENVAVNRGGRVYVTSSEQKALSWLLK